MTNYVLGVKVDTDLTLQKAVDYSASLLNMEGCHYISTTNAEFIVDAQTDPEFLSIINGSDLSTPDGAGVLFALKYDSLSKKLKRNYIYPFSSFFMGLYVGAKSFLDSKFLGERVTGVDLMEELCKYAASNNKNIFLLGGMYKDKKGSSIKDSNDMSVNVANVLKQRYPGLNIVGSSSQFKPSLSDDKDTINFIHKCMTERGVSEIDILFIAYGHPHQEKWISRNRCLIPAKLCIGVGGTFDYICGSKSRSPKVLQNAHLEWLYKLITQPWRFARIKKAFPIFPYLVYKNSLKTS